MISIVIPSGRYVVAVSGGVDSMVLLDVLRHLPDVELVVAHFDHGVRDDSKQDAELVRSVSMSHNLVYVSEAAHLGTGASEEAARNARYAFLSRICKKHNALAVITAHHQDDLLETALINLWRGTGWRGLASLRSTGTVLRPLLAYPKEQLVEYARTCNLIWHEDSTNSDTRYLRNALRRGVLVQITPQQRSQLLQYIVRQNKRAELIDTEVTAWLTQHASHSPALSLPRYQLIMLPRIVSLEILQAVFRAQTGRSVERSLLAHALLFCKVAKIGRVFQLNNAWQLHATYREVIVEPRYTMVS